MMKSALAFLISLAVSTAAFAQNPPSSAAPQYNKSKNVWAGDNFEQVCIIQAVGSPGTFTPTCPSNNITITAQGQTIALPTVGTPPGYQPSQVTKSVELRIFYAAPYAPTFAAGYNFVNGTAPGLCTSGGTGCLSGVVSSNPDMVECRTASETAVRCGSVLTALSGTSSCSQATTFVARTSGENANALTALICGLVSNGMIDSSASMASTGADPYCGTGSVFDRLGVFAMANSTDALLDICGHTGVLAVGSPTFTANQGFTGGADNNSTVYINTQYNQSSSSSLYTQNNAHFGDWVLTNLTGSAGGVSMGVNDNSTSFTRLQPDSSGSAYADIQDTSSLVASVTGAHGDYIVTRSGASARAFYKNGSQIGSDTQASVGLVNFTFYVLSENRGGSPAAGDANQVAVWHTGSNMTTGQLSSFHSLMCTYLTAVSGAC